MMKVKLNAFLVMLILALTSCGTMTEEITLNEDGSGEYKIYSDMLPAMAKGASQMAIMFAEMEGELPQAKKDSIESAAREGILADMPMELDSTIVLTESLPEEILNNPENMAIIERMNAYMRGGQKSGRMDTGFDYGFTDLNDLNDMCEVMKEMNSAGSAMGGGAAGGMGDIEMDAETAYSFDGKRFRRAVKILKEGEIPADQQEMMDMMFDGSVVRTIIHFPRAIKKAKGENLVSVKGKTATYEYSLQDYMTGKTNSSIDVKLQK